MPSKLQSWEINSGCPTQALTLNYETLHYRSDNFLDHLARRVALYDRGSWLREDK